MFAPTAFQAMVGVGTNAFLLFQPTLYDPRGFVESPPYFVEEDLFAEPSFTKLAVFSFVDQKDGQDLVGIDPTNIDTTNAVFRAKQLNQYVAQISGGSDQISRIYAGVSSALVITDQGRILTWSLDQPSTETAALTFLGDTATPQLADRLSLLGSFQILEVKVAKNRDDDPRKVSAALYKIKRTSSKKAQPYCRAAIHVAVL